ncbi:MAG: M1 family aminopeptidase, partial [Thermodesulfobacteriota bacterium]
MSLSVLLRNRDEMLAQKYLETGAQYLAMYTELIGPYPYGKFALVENFWETGYGMPSFTLMGPQVIRFPFILHSSYPHEILHNWWGNGVFVDFESGNWSEGLTAYLADHLIKEQRGQGVEYRLTTLQKYLDYVAGGKDFPLTEFWSRHSPATEAVGYGKTMFFFHMLRLQLGDDLFTRALRQFYSDNKFTLATFEDLQDTFSAVSGRELKTEFDQWIRRTGAPELRVRDAHTTVEGEGFRLTAVIEQIHEGPAYRLRIPVAVHLKDSEEAFQTTIPMDTKVMEISLHLPALPLRLDIDPEFDIFRRLDRNEIPPALSQAFGADTALIVLPSTAPEELRKEYRRLAETWQQSPTRKIEIKLDSDIDRLPKDRTVWLFGRENRFTPQVAS